MFCILDFEFWILNFGGSASRWLAVFSLEFDGRFDVDLYGVLVVVGGVGVGVVELEDDGYLLRGGGVGVDGGAVELGVGGARDCRQFYQAKGDFALDDVLGGGAEGKVYVLHFGF